MGKEQIRCLLIFVVVTVFCNLQFVAYRFVSTATERSGTARLFESVVLVNFIAAGAERLA